MKFMNAIRDFDKATITQLKAEVLAWAHEQIDNEYATAKPLSEQQSLIAGGVGVVNTDSIRLIEIKKLSSPQGTTLQAAMQQTGLLGPGTIGLTLGYLVFFDPEFDSSRLLAHEFRHVFQFEQAGSLEAYLSEYIEQILTFGYQQAPMEIEARIWEQDHR